MSSRSASFRIPAGFLISVEGIEQEACHKLAEMLKDTLIRCNMPSVHYSYPLYDSNSGGLLKAIEDRDEDITPRELAALLSLNHKENQDEILRNLYDGKIVIVSGYLHATAVHSLAYDPSFDIWSLCHGLLLPHLAVLISQGKPTENVKEKMRKLYLKMVKGDVEGRIEGDILRDNMCEWKVISSFVSPQVGCLQISEDILELKLKSVKKNHIMRYYNYE